MIKNLGTLVGGLYNKVFWRMTKKVSEEPIAMIDKMNEKTKPERVIGNEIHKIQTITEYIEKLIVKINGYRDPKHFYQEASMTQTIKKVNIPMFFL